MYNKLKLLLPMVLCISLVFGTSVYAGFSGVVNGDVVNIRESTSLDSEVIGKLGYGTVVNVTGYSSLGWFRISCGNTTGWMHEDYIITRPQKYTDLSQASTEGEKIAAFALGYIGYPYVYGGSSPETGFDCSGFVKHVMNSCGYEVNRIAADQALNGYEVSFYDLVPGDIVLFGTPEYGIDHAGIYIGNRKIIHASQNATGVIISELSGPYYADSFVTARRIAE